MKTHHITWQLARMLYTRADDVMIAIEEHLTWIMNNGTWRPFLPPVLLWLTQFYNEMWKTKYNIINEEVEFDKHIISCPLSSICRNRNISDSTCALSAPNSHGDLTINDVTDSIRGRQRAVRILEARLLRSGNRTVRRGIQPFWLRPVLHHQNQRSPPSLCWIPAHRCKRPALRSILPRAHNIEHGVTQQPLQPNIMLIGKRRSLQLYLLFIWKQLICWCSTARQYKYKINRSLCLAAACSWFIEKRLVIDWYYSSLFV